MNVPFRITLLDPPRGVRFRLQSGQTATAELVPPSREDAGSISFDFELRVADRKANDPPRFLGPAVQGPPSGRFVYINSGTSAGDFGSCWTRRAKIPLAGVTWELIDQVLAKREAVLEVQIQGTGRDGGPVCATVKGIAWRLAAS